MTARLLANALVHGQPSLELLDAIDLNLIDDEWCRLVVASVIVLRHENQPTTIRSVHEVLVEAGVHRDPEDAWRLAMADATLDGGSISEDACAVYLRQLEIETKRRRGREALVRAAHRLETATDPAVVFADLTMEVAA